MGFKPGGTVYKLNFVGEEYEGLELRMRGMSIGRITSLIAHPWDKRDPAKNIEIYDFFASRVVSWNIDHPEIDNPDKDDSSKCAQCGLREDDPMPITGNSMCCLDIVFLMKIFTVWMEAVASVAVPKELNMKVGDEVERLLTEMRTESLPTPSL